MIIELNAGFLTPKQIEVLKFALSQVNPKKMIHMQICPGILNDGDDCIRLDLPKG